MNATKGQCPFEHYLGRIEATHFDDSLFFATFTGSLGHKANLSTIDPQLQALVEDPQFSGSTQEQLYMLDNDGDDLPGKVEVYIKRMASSFIEEERSHFMKQTLALASQLAQEKKVSFLARTKL